MNTDDGWQLVEHARAGIHPDDDAAAIASRMVSLLAQRNPSEIASLEQPLWELLARSYPGGPMGRGVPHQTAAPPMTGSTTSAAG